MQQGTGPNGFPESTPLAEMTDSQQAAYWRHHAKAHRAEAERLKEWQTANERKVGEYDALAAASKTEQERALEAARTEAAEAARTAALAEAKVTYGRQLVAARLDAACAAKGLTAEQMTALAGDGARFVAAQGVDDDALAAFLAAIPDRPAGSTHPQLGGGRTAPPVAGGLEAGRSLWDARHPARNTTS